MLKTQKTHKFEVEKILALQKEANAQLDRMITIGGRKKKKEEDMQLTMSQNNDRDGSLSNRSRRSSRQESARHGSFKKSPQQLPHHHHHESAQASNFASHQRHSSNQRVTPVRERSSAQGSAVTSGMAKKESSAFLPPGVRRFGTQSRSELESLSPSPQSRSPNRRLASQMGFNNTIKSGGGSTLQLGLYKFDGRKGKGGEDGQNSETSRKHSPRLHPEQVRTSADSKYQNAKRDSFSVPATDTAKIINDLKADGQNVDSLARKIQLQRRLSDAINEHAQTQDLQNRRHLRLGGKQIYWNERDEFFGPKHPLKVKYRDLNSQATRLFLKQRNDNLFYDQFSRKEAVNERIVKFQEEVLNIYLRNRKTNSVSPELVDQMRAANTQLKSDYKKATQRMSRQQQNALFDYERTHDFRRQNITPTGMAQAIEAAQKFTETEMNLDPLSHFAVNRQNADQVRRQTVAHKSSKNLGFSGAEDKKAPRLQKLQSLPENSIGQRDVFSLHKNHKMQSVEESSISSQDDFSNEDRDDYYANITKQAPAIEQDYIDQSIRNSFEQSDYQADQVRRLASAMEINKTASEDQIQYGLPRPATTSNIHKVDSTLKRKEGIDTSNYQSRGKRITPKNLAASELQGTNSDLVNEVRARSSQGAQRAKSTKHNSSAKTRAERNKFVLPQTVADQAEIKTPERHSSIKSTLEGEEGKLFGRTQQVQSSQNKRPEQQGHNKAKKLKMAALQKIASKLVQMKDGRGMGSALPALSIAEIDQAVKGKPKPKSSSVNKRLGLHAKKPPLKQQQSAAVADKTDGLMLSQAIERDDKGNLVTQLQNEKKEPLIAENASTMKPNVELEKKIAAQDQAVVVPSRNSTLDHEQKTVHSVNTLLASNYNASQDKTSYQMHHIEPVKAKLYSSVDQPLTMKNQKIVQDKKGGPTIQARNDEFKATTANASMATSGNGSRSRSRKSKPFFTRRSTKGRLRSHIRIQKATNPTDAPVDSANFTQTTVVSPAPQTMNATPQHQLIPNRSKLGSQGVSKRHGRITMESHDVYRRDKHQDIAKVQSHQAKLSKKSKIMNRSHVVGKSHKQRDGVRQNLMQQSGGKASQEKFNSNICLEYDIRKQMHQPVLSYQTSHKVRLANLGSMQPVSKQTSTNYQSNHTSLLDPALAKKYKEYFQWPSVGEPQRSSTALAKKRASGSSRALNSHRTQPQLTVPE